MKSAASAVDTPVTSATVARPAFDDSAITIQDVKLLIVNGRDTDDEDVALSFGNGQVSLAGRKSGSVIAAMPYTSTLRATYTKARDPKWDSTIFGPPPKLDVGGVLRTSKHWLVLQARDAYLILRLEDSNFRQVLEAVGTRTSLPIDRPASNEKP
jgi:hypothetical protein